MRSKNPPIKHSIFLLGMMGAGKTSFGKKLAEKIDYHFVDLDDLIVKQTGVSVNVIFAIEGEKGFRKRETEALKEIIDLERSIIATGGGIITKQKNRLLLEDKFCIYLKTPTSEIIRKIKNSKKRPMLKKVSDDEREKYIVDLIAEREKYYQQLANFVVVPLKNGSDCIEEMAQWIKTEVNKK